MQNSYSYNGYEISPDRLYSVDLAAKILNISESSVRRRLYVRHISYARPATYQIPGKALIEYIQKITIKARLFEEGYY